MTKARHLLFGIMHVKLIDKIEDSLTKMKMFATLMNEAIFYSIIGKRNGVVWWILVKPVLQPTMCCLQKNISEKFTIKL